jgi:putative oligomerization/nucleic acid binding protein
VEIVVVWLALCVLVGIVANNKGHNGLTWGVLAVLISPLIAGIIVLVMRPGTEGRRAQEQGWVTAAIGGGSVADEIGKLAALREAGHLTTEEFDRQKAALLASPPRGSVGDPTLANWGSSEAGSDSRLADWNQPKPVIRLRITRS